MNEYDVNALYLYSDGYAHKIGRISKINKQSIRMEGGVKIDKEVFKSVHKLTDEEVAISNRELVKKLSASNRSIQNMIETMKSLQLTLNKTEFVCVDSEKLQNEINILADILAKEVQSFNIDGKSYNFHQYSERIIESKED